MQTPTAVSKLKVLYHEYPPAFWTLVLVTFIDHFGYFLLYPFFSFYITSRFGVGMTTVGVLYAVFSITGLIGNGLGGALSDRLGRRSMVIFSLVTTALTSVLLGFAPSITAMFVITFLVGTLSETGGPANQAIVADLLPDEQRAEGYGILRVARGISAALGPAIGGLIASRSYLALFLIDAVISLLTAFVAFRGLPETKPQLKHGEQHEKLSETFRGYAQVFKDSLFLLFIVTWIFSNLPFMNMRTTLGVFLRDVHGVSEQNFGLLLTFNAALVIIFQFWITRRLQKASPMKMLALGSLLLSAGVALFGFVSGYNLFFLAIGLMTVGDMIQTPFGQSLVAKFSPEHMRGRYMAIFALTWNIPFAFGPYLGGLILDNWNPSLLWYASGLAGLASAGGYLFLKKLMDQHPDHLPREEPLRDSTGLP